MNEQQLITALQLGDETAFALLVEQYQQMVFNTVLGLVQQTQDAEDIAQEVFIQVHQSVRNFKGESKLSTWLYRICITKSLDWKKHQQRNKRFAVITNLFGNNSKYINELPGFDHPGVQLARKENAALLFKALNQIPENQRVAFVLQKLEGLGQAEIAAVMQLSEGAVESLLQRARKNLKKMLEHYYQNS